MKIKVTHPLEGETVGAQWGLEMKRRGGGKEKERWREEAREMHYLQTDLSLSGSRLERAFP